MNEVYGRCTLCGTKKEIEHFKIYVDGSEGLNLCGECKMEITEFCRVRRTERTKAKLQEYKREKLRQQMKVK